MKNLLKSGVFGILANGDKFVVVDDMIVYQDGGHDSVYSLNDDLIFMCTGRKIEKLCEVCCFDDIDDCVSGSIIFDRNEYEVVEMTIEEIKEKLNIKNLKIIKEGK